MCWSLLLPILSASPLEMTSPLELTVFHVNPLHEGVLPIDMDTADLAGDAFFDLRSRVLPIECANGTEHRSDDCTNGEVVDQDLVITKLKMTIKNRHFGPYGRCNICGPSGTDPFSGLPCEPNKYLCSCGEYWDPRDCNNQTAVGAENITEAFGRWGNACSWDRWIKAPWTCWPWPVVDKTGGMWYSTTRAGWCDAPDADPERCTWRADVVKVVNKSCSDNLINSAIERYDEEHSDGCFKRCPQRQRHPSHRNTSDTCWVYCFYATVLGAPALLPGGASTHLTTGMPRTQVEAAFSAPFLEESAGGCPAIKAPPLSSATPLSTPQTTKPLPQRAIPSPVPSPSYAAEDNRSPYAQSHRTAQDDALSARSAWPVPAMTWHRVYREAAAARALPHTRHQ